MNSARSEPAPRSARSGDAVLLLGTGGGGVSGAAAGVGIGQQTHDGRVERWLSAEGEGDGDASGFGANAPSGPAALLAPVHVHLPPPGASPSALAVGSESSGAGATPAAAPSGTSDVLQAVVACPEETAGAAVKAAPTESSGNGGVAEPTAPTEAVAAMDQSVDRQHLLTRASAGALTNGGPETNEFEAATAEASARLQQDAVHVPDDQETPLLPGETANA